MTSTNAAETPGAATPEPPQAPESMQSEQFQPVRVIDAPLAPPSDNMGLLSVFRKRYLLRLLVRREIQGRYAGSLMGLFWSYINPLSQFFIYWFVVGKIMGAHQNVENYGIHVFAGMVVVHFFTETFGAGTRSLVSNKALVNRLALPREMFPVAAMLVSLYHVLPATAILVIASLLSGWMPDVGTIFGILLGLGIIMCLGTALALIFSVANVFWRDFGSAVSILTMFVRFGVPMMYSYAQIYQRFGHWAHYYLINPIANAVLLFQRAFWVGSTKNPKQTIRTSMPEHLWLYGLITLGACFIVLVLCQMIFSKFENRIPERL